MTKKVALVLGVTGQDGAYLAEFLLKKNYHVIGTSRDAHANNTTNLKNLGIHHDIQMESLALLDFRSVVELLRSEKPVEVYHLAGQTSVGLSFDQPIETFESVSISTLSLLEAIRLTDLPIRFYSAGSGEVFGDTLDKPANEESRFKPRSPYGIAKASAFWCVANYREAYKMHASTGILFNHESPFRPGRFVTQKIIHGACKCARTGKGRLKLGNLDIARDWGWAPEYVEAMWKMLQLDEAQDFVIATGKTVTLEKFIDIAFSQFDLNWKDWVDLDPKFSRPTDIKFGSADPRKAERLLDWKARLHVEQVIDLMTKAALEQTDCR
ncbi:GDP-mannose 4,6-dehydratase [Limnobacter parvus]|uniref:GDP-mannose 4,6-dehydratase n=1 Tax=Limnobacter parvus TaxID=2939690 RepID=A0ABT1XD88_9BURK|nr:GDP-mannose 4,6-dehydratase [Limnobacter parvus]MCR2745242.1 GDP-mannose 4,6-dehydratase [Limnobacter parvus]